MQKSDSSSKQLSCFSILGPDYEWDSKVHSRQQRLTAQHQSFLNFQREWIGEQR